MSKVYDCFVCCDEADVLEIRLNELDPVVGHFVLCEATRTFTEQPKPLRFLEHKDQLARFLPKITHLIVDDFPLGLAAFAVFGRGVAVRRMAYAVNPIDWAASMLRRRPGLPVWPKSDLCRAESYARRGRMAWARGAMRPVRRRRGRTHT